MVYAKIDGGRDRGAPIVKALPRSAVNQIHAGAQPSLVRRIDAYGHVGRRMRAVEGFEHVRHGRLHAEGNTGEAAGSELIDVILVDRVRIGFGSDFRVGRDAPDLADGIEHGDQIAGGENCGGAAAEEHGGNRRLLDAVVELPLLGQFHFPNDHIGIDERLLRHLHMAEHLHALLASLLLFEQLALTGDVAAVALGEHVLA